MKTSNLWNVTQHKITHQEEKANGYKLKLHDTELRKLQIKSLQKKENQKRYEIKLSCQKEQADQNFIKIRITLLQRNTKKTEIQAWHYLARLWSKAEDTQHGKILWQQDSGRQRLYTCGDSVILAMDT